MWPIASLGSLAAILTLIGGCHTTPPLEAAASEDRSETRCGPVDPSPLTPAVRPHREPVVSIAPMASRDGSPDAGLISTSIDLGRARTQLLGCYQQLLARDPDEEGTVIVTFRVRADGSPANLVLHGFDAILDACLCQQLASLRFDAGAPTEVRYPLVFNAGHR